MSLDAPCRDAIQEILSCQVKGDFEARGDKLTYARVTDSGVVVCTAPLLIVEHKLGLSCVADAAVHPAAKPSETRFTKLLYDRESDFSLILCEPVTDEPTKLVTLAVPRLPIHNDPLTTIPSGVIYLKVKMLVMKW